MSRGARPGWKRRLSESRFFRRALAEAAAPPQPAPKVTLRFLSGLAAIVLSYFLAWPLIGLLGVISVRRRQPAIVAVGGPIAYGVATLVFLLGVYLVGRDGLLHFRRVLYRWAACFHSRHLADPPDVIERR